MFLDQVYVSVHLAGKESTARHRAKRACTGWIAHNTANVRTAASADQTTVTVDARQDGRERDVQKVSNVSERFRATWWCSCNIEWHDDLSRFQFALKAPTVTTVWNRVSARTTSSYAIRPKVACAGTATRVRKNYICQWGQLSVTNLHVNITNI